MQKKPEQTGNKHLRSYFQAMLSDGQHKAGSVKMGYYALKFLFTQILHKEWAKEYLPTSKTAKTLPMVLYIDEFIRRFLLHLLPKGFLKVRYYEIFSNRYRKVNTETAKKILLQDEELQKHEDMEDGNTIWQKQDTVWNAIQTLMKNYSPYNCPCCKKGHLRYFGVAPG